MAVHENIKDIKTVKELFSDKNRWTTGWYAKDINDEDVDSLSKDACKWCVAGGLIAVYGDNASVVAHKILEALPKKYWNEYYSLVALNDKLGYDILMEVLEEANV